VGYERGYSKKRRSAIVIKSNRYSTFAILPLTTELKNELRTVDVYEFAVYPEMGYPQRGYSILAGCRNHFPRRNKKPFLSFFAKSEKRLIFGRSMSLID
jgi:hypothetical protein